MKLKFFFLIIILLYPINLQSSENKIIVKINNDIITSIDLINEIKYLTTLNPSIKKLNNQKINEIALNSLIKEKIKSIEIKKLGLINEIQNNYLNNLYKNIYTNLGLSSLSDFKKYLNIERLDLETVKKKIEIEALWNQIIYTKFSNKIKINRSKLRQKIIEKKDRKLKIYDLQEIVFEIKSKDELSEKYQLIKDDISTKGFSNAVLIHSISDTNKISGKIGLISENSLNDKIKNELSLTSIGEYTKPIIIPGGALILKINEIKFEKKEFDTQKEFEKLTINETNRQLNQFSNLYFNKIKRNVVINEL